MNELLFYKSNLKIYISSALLVILVILMLIISLFYKFTFHFSYNGIVIYEEGEYYVSIILSDNEISKIKKVFLVVDKNHINYEVSKISSEYVLTESGPKREVQLKFNLNEEDKINNNVIILNFIYEKTIFNKLKEML